MKLPIVFLLVLIPLNSYAQWVNEIFLGEEDYSLCENVFKTESGSLIASGKNNDIPYLLKFDSDYHLVFSKTLGEWNSKAGTLTETIPNHFVYATSKGKRTTTFSNSDVLLTKIDTSGNVIWQKAIHDDSCYNYINHGISLADSVLYFVGEAYSNYSSKGLVYKMNFEGDTIWTRKISAPAKKYTVFKNLIISEDGGIIITGHAGSEEYGLPYLIKINSKGTVLNEMLIDDSERSVSFLNDIIYVGDGEYIIAGGTSFNISYNLYILKINNELDTIWTRKYLTERFQTGQRIKSFEQNKFTILCSGEDAGQGLTSFFYINENGDSLRSEGFFVLDESYPYSEDRDIIGKDFLRNEDGSYVMVGAKADCFYVSQFDYLLFKCPFKTYSAYCSNKIQLANKLMYFGSKNVDIDWSTDFGVEDTEILNQEIKALVDTTYIITVSDGTKTVTDSFSIKVNPVQINTALEREKHCEDSIQLNLNLVGIRNPELFNFEWSPNEGLSNPNLQNPYCSINKKIYYTVSASYETCQSTETIFVNYIKPNYNIEFDVDKQLLNEPPFAFQFENNTPDLINYNFIWDFGDGNTLHSNNFVVFHEYNFNGLYDVKLIAQSKEFKLCKDSLTKSDFIYTTGGEDPTWIEINNSQVNIYPNPVNNVINIEIIGEQKYIVKLYAISGQLYYEKEFFGSKNILDIKNLKTGLYILNICTDEWMVTDKVIKY